MDQVEYGKFKKAQPPTVEELNEAFTHFEFIELIEEGGMGAVYKASSPKYEVPLAIKVMPRRYSHDPAFCELLNREEELTSSLVHPNIVQFYEFGVIAEYPYIAMEYIPGETLHDTIPDDYLDPVTASNWVAQVCDGLAHAHMQGVVHLDIKPGNIMVTPDRVVKIIDFGLARGMSEYHYRGEKLWGSEGYTAPERRTRPEVLDYRSDVYSVGVMYCFIVTGYLPSQLVNYSLPAAGIPEELCTGLISTLEPMMEKRLSAISEFANVLRAYEAAEVCKKKGKGLGKLFKTIFSSKVAL